MAGTTRDHFRIYPQMLTGFGLSILIFGSMVQQVTMTDVVVLPFAVSLFMGGILALGRKPLGDWLLLLGSLAVLTLGTFLHCVRIAFILRHGGMEGANGFGSPLAFLLGWVTTTVLLFLPGLVCSIWNGREIARKRGLLGAVAS